MPHVDRELLTQLDDEQALLVGLSGDAEVYRVRHNPTFSPGIAIRIARDGAARPRRLPRHEGWRGKV